MNTRDRSLMGIGVRPRPHLSRASEEITRDVGPRAAACPRNIPDAIIAP